MDFIRKNLALAAGIGLPIIVVIIFSLAMVLPVLFVAPPRYDALFLVNFSGDWSRENDGRDFKFVASGNHLKSYQRPTDKKQYNGMATRLFRFDARTLGVHEISFILTPAIADSASQDWVEFSLPEIQALVLDTNTVAPDGYEFDDSTDSAPAFSSLFYSGANRQDISINKNGRRIKMILPNSNKLFSWNNNVHFLGWISQGSPQ